MPQNTKDTLRKFSSPVLGDTFLARFVVTGSGTPSSGGLGDIFFDTATNIIMIHNGTKFVGLTLS